ncbi:MAG: TonB-dependent hemoglobin/transferrin/lactoferrin family receptor [Thalassobaculales bacterium]
MSASALRLALLAGVSMLALDAAAQSVPPQPAAAPATELDAVSVSATRTGTPVEQVPGTVTVIEREQLDRWLVNSPRDLLRYEPGVSIGNSPNRVGLGNYSIRGIDGNRVLVLVDGVRMPDYPGSTRSPGLYTRDVMDFENLKRVEIVRGPASALYGSDAIGGVVAYTTKDPGDYLAEVGKDWYIGLRGVYSTIDESLITTATTAMRAGSFEVLGQVSRRGFEEAEPNDPGTTYNTQDGHQVSGLGKLVWFAGDADVFRVTVERSDRTVDTNLNTDLGVSQGTNVLSSTAEDKTARTRISLDWEHTDRLLWADAVQAKLYWHAADRTEHREQLRQPTTSTQQRWRTTDNGFNQDLYGGDLQFENRYALGGFDNRLIYGGDLVRTDTTRPRNQVETNLSTGAVTTTFAGEVFPNKTFPDTTTLQGGLFVQNEAKLGNWTFLPALRFDYYNMEPKPDAASRANSAGASDPQEVTETALSPKFGLSYQFSEALTVFGQYARGFRAPPYDDANLGFTNSLQGYQVLPNANLKPETVDGFETGLRGRLGQRGTYQVAAFYNLYKDFIEQTYIGRGSNGLMQYQAQNLPEVEIYGAEARASWRLTPEVTLLGSAAYAHGENTETGQPINSVDPVKLVTGARYDHPTDGWGLEGVVTHVFAKDETATAGGYLPGDYTLLDLYGYWQVNATLSLNLALTNLTDERYFVWQDVQAQPANSSTIGRYASPGRGATVGVSMKF